MTFHYILYIQLCLNPSNYNQEFQVLDKQTPCQTPYTLIFHTALHPVNLSLVREPRLFSPLLPCLLPLAKAEWKPETRRVGLFGLRGDILFSGGLH